MKQRVYIYIKYHNVYVLKTYLDTIKKAIENLGFECEYIESLDGINKKSLLVFPMGIDAFKWYHKGFRNIILWQQGVTAEESFMRHHSKMRFKILNAIDCFVMKKAKMIFFVSNSMKNYYEKMSGCVFDDKSYIMPCYNEQLDLDVFSKKDYSKKIFSYVGSLDLWQCFEQTVDTFVQIEKAVPGAFLKVLTFETDKAEKILVEKGVKNYSVNCVPKEKVKAELEEVSYGFVLREDIIVNNVATPTKFSSYLSTGVIPIYSKCLEDFDSVAKEMKCAFGTANPVNIDELIEFINNTPDLSIIENEIKQIFDGYYNTERHVKNIARILEGLFK